MAWFLHPNLVQHRREVRASVRGNPSGTSLASFPGRRKDRFLRRMRFAVTMITLWLISDPSPLIAQKPVPVDLAGLGRPPEPIAAWIRLGQVTFEAGPRDVRENPGADPRITAETHYRIAYDFASRSRWRITPDKKQVVIHVRFIRVEWKPEHTIWFRSQPSASDFWSDKTLLHEFDHVRISSDPRLRTRFEQKLQDQKVLTRPIAPGEVVNQRLVDRTVEEHAGKVFAEIADLIEIRYKELDRVTDHGQRPVPSESPLNEFLSRRGQDD